MKSLTAKHLKERLDRGDALHLIDVLPRVSFDKKHLPGAISVSMYEDGFLERIDEVVQGTRDTIVVYCVSASCNASTKAAQTLVEAGYTDVYDYEGGVREWEEAGFALRGSAAS